MKLNISYCPPNITIWDIWVDHGTSQCFMDTVTTSVITCFILIAGTLQLCMYRKYGTEVSPAHLPTSKLYYLQLFLTIFLPILEVTRFALQATILNDKTIYGYMILSLVMTVVAYPFSIWVIKVERHYQLPSLPPRGHGIVLLVFWSLTFIAENLAFLNLGQQNWWFHLSDQIEMALFVLRYVTCLLIFFLGLKAPGIMQNIDYFSLNDAQRNFARPMN
ncbi:unnamed protein product [Callosobruchus maculatus]|uniref:ATP-binding cassette sub-family B member 6 N-terminal five TM domain-containing protein n=1 Tax=Callosobruchus maculatus TaxID=64391 RepID=A0A653DDI5_CALMS|nr:unnamed protein product [Callosobruchus maculatus]